MYTVDKQSTVSVKGVHYSVPDSLVRDTIPVKLYSEKVVICDPQGRAVAQHERSYKSVDWVLNINHYLNTLLKKTAALEHAEAFHQMPKAMQDLFRVHFKDNGKDFIKLLKYSLENGLNYQDILDGAAEARRRGLRRLTSDHIKAAISVLKNPDSGIAEDKKDDPYLEIEIGADDVLSQLECAMEKGATK